jgi:hypothetical protein
MSVDLRTELNACDAITGFVGDGPVGVDNTTGFVYQGTNAITTQHTNVDEGIYTTTIGGTRNLSDATCYMILKDNLVQTAANGGVQYMLFDGTDRIGYGVGGNDNPGMALDVFWNSYKLDVTTIGAVPYTNTYAGVLANLTTTAITGVGLGTVHLAKAQGNVDNIKLDRMSFHANGSYALQENGGTSGTPRTTANLLSDSITNGWGLVANPTGSSYTFHGPIQFGEPTNNTVSYFTATDAQWTLIGGVVGATHFPFQFIGNAGANIQSFVLDGVAITNVGTRAEFDFSSANINSSTIRHTLTGVTFTDIGATTFSTVNDVNRTLASLTYNNADIIDFGATTLNGAIINGTTRANGALVLNENTTYVSNQSNITFNSDGTGHAFEIAPTGAGPFTYNLTGWTYNGYAGTDGTTGNEALFINPSTLSANITINIASGDTPTVREVASYTGTLTINNNVTVTITVQDAATAPVVGAVVGIYNANTNVELENNETDGSGIVTFSTSASQPVYVRVLKSTTGSTRYVPVETTGNTGSGLNLTVTLNEDGIVDP